MNTTILLSMQRSGTTFIDTKLNGMCGVKTHGGEVIANFFYNRHNVNELVRCDNLYDKKKHVLPRFSKSVEFENGCYVEVNEHFISTVVNKSNHAVFNLMLNATKFNIDVIQSIKTPILFLVRKNNWKRCVSELVMQETEVSHIKKKSEILDVNLNKEKIIRNCKRTYNYISDFQKQLKNQKNVKIIYYEDIENKEYWTDEFINELEDFMKVKFTNKNFITKHKKTRNYVNIINESEIMHEEYIKKYYIKEI